ncbi:hypothetical protein VTK56DRAFT_5176 [Thermocarpiscus australiensis]
MESGKLTPVPAPAGSTPVSGGIVSFQLLYLVSPSGFRQPAYTPAPGAHVNLRAVRDTQSLSRIPWCVITFVPGLDVLSRVALVIVRSGPLRHTLMRQGDRLRSPNPSLLAAIPAHGSEM